MAPTIGRIVHYRLRQQDADAINRRRHDGTSANSAANDHSGAIVHVGSAAKEGDIVPMMVTKVWTPSTVCVNGQAFLDGNDTLWVMSANRGDTVGTWDWPLRIE